MTLPEKWLSKPYYSFDAYCKHTFGEKLYKIALDAGMNCPNRDGALDTRGCTFCSEGGSGDFAIKDLEHAVSTGRSLFQGKKTGQRYIGYFQAYTNTYAPVSYLEKVFSLVLDQPDIAGISIATRPDCLDDNVLALLSSLKERYAPKFIWIELGLQTMHEKTAVSIRRGYPLSVFTQAVSNLRRLSVPVIAHIILGLPGETPEMVSETIRYLNGLSIQGIKLQLLHVLKNTELAEDYAAGAFEVLSLPAYMDLLTACIARLSPEIVIHRVTGDGPKDLLIAPLWSLDKRKVLNTLHREMKQRNLWEGCLYDAGTTDAL